ncbi:Retrovirus-related Pol polyprotein from transposon 17.6 [Vitis vinifera]|uniref:Retrovirus-related Pol polyprotein from transposon 17.6 n=1 Tax=Vitis vinifera TaxID=29760 RepID=A0A438BMC8_VITVI|nr:Retrovirus-related Pol polyprotein from transposon 17.6 [Vitis vinifera]
MDVSVESKSLPSVGYSRKSYLQTTSQRLARDKLVHLNGRRSLALSSVGPGGLQGDFGNLDIKYLNQNIPEDLKMSVANIRKLQENTAAVQHSAFSLDRMKFLPGWNFYSDGNPTRMAFLPGWNSYPDGNELDVDQLASGSASSAGSLSQLRDFGAKGEGIQEAQMLRGDEYKSTVVFLKRRVTASQFWKHHLHTRIIFGGVSEEPLTEFGIFYQPAELVGNRFNRFSTIAGSLFQPVQHHSWQPLSAMRNTCLSLSGSHSSGLELRTVSFFASLIIRNFLTEFGIFYQPLNGLEPVQHHAGSLVSHEEHLPFFVWFSLIRRLARDHRYASLALRLARDHSESHRSGGSGEGPQIGNSAGDRTQNLWFHKRIKLELELGLLIEIDLGSRGWIRIGDRLVRGSDSPSQLEQIPDHRDMDPQYATVDQLAEITDTMASLRDAILGLVPPPPPPPVQSAPQAGAFVLHGQIETTPHSVVAPAQIVDDTQARIDRIEQRMRSLHVSDGLWWCCSALVCLIGPSRRRTWADLGQEFIRRYSFNTIVDVSRRELEALRQGPDETVTSFISRWREKIAQIIDKPSERDQISMIMRSLQPRFARHLMGFPQTNFGSLVQALYGIEEGISRGHRSSRRPPFQCQFLGTPYQMIQHDQYRPVAPIRSVGPTYLHPPPQPVYATQAPQRPPMQVHHQYKASPPPSPVRQFTQLGMPLSRAFQRLGLVDLGRPGVATDPLPTHDTRAVPPPPEGVHLIEFAGDEIFMMGWDGEAPQPISLYEESDFVGYIPRQQIPRPFSLTPDRIYGPPPVSPIYLQHVPPMTPFILFPEEYRPPHRDVQIVTRSGRVAQPPPVDRPFAGIVAREEVQSEDDEILRQLCTTQARISIWSLLASSSTHRDALVRALGQIRVDTATTPEGLIHMLTADKSTCRRVPFVLLDNGSALNVCPLVTAIALRFSPDDFGPSTQTVRAYDGTQRTVMGTLSTHVMIGPVSYSIVFQVLRIQSSFNLLLGRPWIHEAGVIPSSLHQKVKFIHEGRIITIQSDRDIITSSEPVLHISHSEDDLHLTGFTFDEVQVVSLEDGSRDMGPYEFTFTVDYDTPYGLGYIPTEADARYVSQLRRDRLADYFIRGSEHTPRTKGTVHIPETVEIQDISRPWVLDYDLPMDLGYGTNKMDMIGIGRIFDAVPHGPHTVFDMFGVFVLETDEDDSIPDAYTDDMDFIGIGHIFDAAPRGPLSVFDISGVSVLDDESVLDVVTSDFASVEGESDSVDPPLSFDTMSEFVTRFDDISDGNNDMSIFEYLNVSQHFPLIAPPAPMTHIYDVDDVGDTDDPLGGHSECDFDTEDRKVTPISSSTELIDFGAPDQPREIRIGSSLSPYEGSRLIDLLRPVKQKLRRLHPRWSLQDDKVRVCVDFRDLNKASPKDDFPLPHIDMLVDSTAGHPMLSFMDGFSRYNQILMAPKDMVKTSFITEWGTYCYRVMPFGLKNAGATYQRATTTLFHDMMHKDVEVYVDEMIVKSRDRADHLAALQRFFERIRQFRLRLNPKKCTFGVTFGKLLGHIVSEQGIEVDPEKIRAILDMPTPRTKKEIRGFLSRLQYISRFIARLTNICEPILCLLRKNQPTVWNDDFSDMALGCMLAQLDDLGKEQAIYYLSKRMLEYEGKYIMIERLCLVVVWATRRLRHYMKSILCSWSHDWTPLRYLFDRPVMTGRLMRWLVLLTEFDIHYVTQKSVKGSIVADHLASLLIFDDRSVDDDFPDEQIVSMTSITGVAGDHIPISVRLAFSDHHRLTNNIIEYEACIIGLETALDLGIRQLEIHGDSNLVIKQTQGIYICPGRRIGFADALATLASLIVIPAGFLSCDAYPESASAKDRRALRQLATRFVVCGDALYRRSPNGLLLLCLDRASTDRVMREVHAGVCGPHMGGHMLARKIMRTGYFWLTMETDCCQFVQRYQECQMHGDLIHVPPSELHALASPWPFSVWGIDIIGKISPKSSSGHEYILVAIDYFTKWVEAASYARLIAVRVAKFIRSHIICRYGVPHELISDRGVHFKGEVDTLIQEYGIQHHRSSAYRP